MTVALLTFLLSTPPTITIDDAPDHRHHYKMLRVLKKHRKKAVFFILGAMLQNDKNKVLLKRIVADGHELGNHLYSHLSPCKPIVDMRGHPRNPLGVHRSLREARRTRREIRQVLGRPVKIRYWRSPFGHYCPKIFKNMRKLGYKHLYWHAADIGGSARHMQRIVRCRQPKPTILLFHYDAAMLRRILLAK